jgi:hypothetical protein
MSAPEKLYLQAILTDGETMFVRHLDRSIDVDLSWERQDKTDVAYIREDIAQAAVAKAEGELVKERRAVEYLAEYIVGIDEGNLSCPDDVYGCEKIEGITDWEPVCIECVKAMAHAEPKE